MAEPPIKIVGLKEFQKSLREMDADLPKQLRVALNQVSDLVINYARPKMPSITGDARRSLKARSSQRAVRIAMGGRRAPHAPWLDFGGAVGPNRSVLRPFLRRGRYLYPALDANHEEVTKVMAEALTALAAGAGLDVT